MERGAQFRDADDLKRGLTNRATQVLMPVYFPTWGHFCPAIKSLMAQHPTERLATGKANRSDAYMSLPLAPAHRWHATITLGGPHSGKPRAFLPNTHLFGRAAAVLWYYCLSRAIATLATRLLEIPCVGYFGDFVLI